MKKLLVLLMVVSLMFSVMGCSKDEAESGFTPSGDIEWVVTSSAGGGSSIFTQKIVDIIGKEALVDETITINYQTDGGGAVGRRRVSGDNSKGHTLLTFNSGDLQPFVQNENGALSELTPLAVMALDGQIILVHKDFKYQTIEEIIEALKAGERIIVGGSKSDDEAIYNALVSEVGGDLAYIRADSTGEVLTQLLGRHVDIAIAKPAASFDYVSSKELVPVVSAGATRFGAPFDTAPTFTELGYDIKFQIFRGIAGPKDMTPEEVTYWTEVFSKVAGTDSWNNEYIGKFLLVSNYLNAADSQTYMQSFEELYKK